MKFNNGCATVDQKLNLNKRFSEETWGVFHRFIIVGTCRFTITWHYCYSNFFMNWHNKWNCAWNFLIKTCNVYILRGPGETSVVKEYLELFSKWTVDPVSSVSCDAIFVGDWQLRSGRWQTWSVCSFCVGERWPIEMLSGKNWPE